MGEEGGRYLTGGGLVGEREERIQEENFLLHNLDF